MARYIDADKIPYVQSEDGVLNNYAYRYDINNIPTVDPVEHGKWTQNTDDFTPAYRCSVCRYNMPMIAGENVSQGAMNYCPNCGAKMDKE